MRKVFIDTSIISEFSRGNINTKELNYFFQKKDMIPIVGIYTTYELSRTILTNPSRASQIFSFIRDLNPDFSCQRNDLYAMESEKLKTNKPLIYTLKKEIKTLLLQRIDDYCNGKFDPIHKNFIRERQNELESSRKLWDPIKIDMTHKKYRNNFSLFRNDFFLDLKSNSNKIRWIKDILSKSTKQKIILTEKEIVKFVDNLISYPAMRSLIYTHIYLQFLSGANNAIPAEDRFTDALVMIEGSYCDIILSSDQSFMKNHAKDINPHIESIYLNPKNPLL